VVVSRFDPIVCDRLGDYGGQPRDRGGTVGPIFEENPWLFIPLVIVIVEVWGLVKRTVARSVKRSAIDEAS
jgi:hypothetical protein